MRGAANATKAALRQACISISSDWLSCSAMPRALPTGWRRQSRGRPSLVEAVAGLVQHAHQGAREVGLVVARGDAHVVGRAAGEGMRGDVEATVREVEADAGGISSSPSVRCCSTGNGPSSGERLAGLLPGAPSTRPRRSGRKCAARRTARRCAPSGCPARTRRAARRRARCRAWRPWPRRRGASRSAPPPSVGSSDLKSAFFLAARQTISQADAGARARLDQVGRHGALVHPEPAHLAQVGRPPGVERRVALLRRATAARACRGRRSCSWAITPKVASWSARSSLAPSGIMAERSQFRIAAGAADGAQPREAALELGIGIVGDHGPPSLARLLAAGRAGRSPSDRRDRRRPAPARSGTR